MLLPKRLVDGSPFWMMSCVRFRNVRFGSQRAITDITYKMNVAERKIETEIKLGEKKFWS